MCEDEDCFSSSGVRLLHVLSSKACDLASTPWGWSNVSAVQSFFRQARRRVRKRAEAVQGTSCVQLQLNDRALLGPCQLRPTHEVCGVA